jgi:sugar O-acyltransferase (sialic acid O-acetyltransferase NeuD family)
MSKSNIILFGYSGHAKVVIDCFESHDITISGYFDKKEAADNVHYLPFFGFEQEIDLKESVNNCDVFPAIGDNKLREIIISTMKESGLKQTRCVHISSALSNYATVGLSSMVGPNAVINSGVIVGNGVIINSNATVEHDCFIEDYCHVAPGAILAGNVKVGKSTFIGAGATIKQGVTIGKNVTIGAGSVVLKDIPDNETWAGVPAKKLK